MDDATNKAFEQLAEEYDEFNALENRYGQLAEFLEENHMDHALTHYRLKLNEHFVEMTRLNNLIGDLADLPSPPADPDAGPPNPFHEEEG